MNNCLAFYKGIIKYHKMKLQGKDGQARLIQYPTLEL